MRSLIAGVLLAAPMIANAYTWDQSIDFNPDPKLTWLSTYTFSHDLKTDGFNPGIDSISSYSVTIDLYNDDGKLDAIYIDQPGVSADSGALLYNWSYASLTAQGSYQGVASLNTDGLLSISLTSLLGTFYLDSSELKATGTQGATTHAVPEPTSAALLAAGLLGIAVMRRKQQNN